MAKIPSVMFRKHAIVHTFLTVMVLVCVSPDPAQAYIGPGAGFALISSFLTLFLSFFLAFFSFLTWPFRMLVIMIRRRKAFAHAQADRVIILGLDGLDPELCEKYMAAGKMPHFSRLKHMGSFKRLATTYPALSPVAWSTFATGVNPARHNIYDFLMRNPHTYLPELSSSKVSAPKRVLNVGKYAIPLGKPAITSLRKSKSFWKILGEYGIFSHIIRVPITFPPEEFRGAMLSAMCTPDLQGTQGTFTFYGTADDQGSKYTGGKRLQLQRQGNEMRGELIGPPNVIRKSAEPIKLPFELTVHPEKKQAEMRVEGKKYVLQERKLTPWIKLSFKAGLGIKIYGICQFYLKQTSPEVALYASPINIDPEKPALPISHPYFFSVYFAKLFGSYSTLGMAEDTWAMNEHVLDEEAFLEQAYRIHGEREQQFFHALDKTRKGVCACVFDGTDRIQHMFFRYLVDGHPANRGKDPNAYKHVIEDLYQRADHLLGRVMERIDNNTILLAISDHGFTSFVRGVDLNAWLHQNGYLKLKNGDHAAEYFQNVDWSNTRAYAVGLGGMYLNVKGREKFGCVEPGEEAKRLKDEIVMKLSGLRDPATEKIAINKVYDSKKIYSGAYVDEAPDFIIGFNAGYRISWGAAIGKTSQEVFEDNMKCWSGDHCVDPTLVPGVLFCNRKVLAEKPRIADLAPTVLKLFGVPVPAYMDGKSLEFADFEAEKKNGGMAPCHVSEKDESNYSYQG